MRRQRDEAEWALAVRQQAAVGALGQLALRSVDLDEVLAAGMASVAEILGLEDIVLFDVRSDLSAVRVRAAYQSGTIAPRSMMERIRLPVGLGSLPGYVVSSGAVVVSDDLLDDDRFRSMAQAYESPVRAAIGAAIGWEQRPWGVLAAYDRVPRSWTEDDAQFVQSVAVTMGLAVRRFQIEHALHTSSMRLDLSLVAGGLGTWSWNVGDDSVWLSGAAMEIFGVTDAEFGGIGDDLLNLAHPEDRADVKDAAFGALQARSKQHHTFRLQPMDGVPIRWVQTWAERFLDEDGEHLVGVVEDITERRQGEVERESLLVREQAARFEAERAQERLTFLADASVRLGASLDLVVTVDAVTELCVPHLADVCLVDLIDEDEGRLVELGARGRDEQSLAAARALRRRREELGGTGGIWSEADVVARGRIQLYRDLTDDDFVGAAVDADHLALFRRFGATSAVLAPLVARGRVIGVLSLVRTRTLRPYDTEDLTLVEEVASRAALAIDNGRLYHSRTRVARSLQAALLPPTVPVVDGLALAARYEVADDAAEIGGDFYDVVEVEPNVWGIVVGDVCGRGPDAAALTGLVRHSIRSAVVHERGPVAVLTHTNAAVLDQIDDTRFCTAAYLRVAVSGKDSTDGNLVEAVVSSAGHPLPVLVRADGGAELLACGGTLLGVVAEPTLSEIRCCLAAGDAIVVYTDGVTEARHGRDLFGEPRLLATLTDLAGRPAGEIAQGLHDAVVAFRGQASDDIAIVVVQAAEGDQRTVDHF